MNNAKRLLIVGLVLLALIGLTGCEDEPFRAAFFTGAPTTDEGATAASVFKQGEEVYLNLFLIETPIDYAITCTWLKDGQEIKQETQTTPTNMRSILHFKLEREKITSGQYIVKVYYSKRFNTERSFKVE